MDLKHIIISALTALNTIIINAFRLSVIKRNNDLQYNAYG